MNGNRRREVVICGGGIAGMTLSLALARQGHRVTIVDRDASPRPAAVTDAAAWERNGVAQFQQPHAFLARFHTELRSQLPDVLDAIYAAGGVDADLPGGLRSFWARRSTVEWALRGQVEREPGVNLQVGTVREVEVSGGQVAGVRLESGARLPADLVADCGGRRGRLSAGLIETKANVGSDEVYTSRRYRARPGRQFGPVNRGVIAVEESDGYSLLVFPHDAGMFTVAFTRLPDDVALAALRDVPAFDAAARSTPMGAAWTDPDFAEPMSAVSVMGGLRSVYRAPGPATPLGLHAVGDSACITNPHFGRGSSLAVAHALRLAQAVADDPTDPGVWRERDAAWAQDELWARFDECVSIDRGRAAGWRSVVAGGSPGGPGSGPGGGGPGSGRGSGLGSGLGGGRPGGSAGGPPGGGGPGGPGRLPKGLILAASGADPAVAVAVFRHMHLAGPPNLLDEVEPRVRDLFAGGWRPSRPPGLPSRAELVEVIAAATSTLTPSVAAPAMVAAAPVAVPPTVPAAVPVSA